MGLAAAALACVLVLAAGVLGGGTLFLPLIGSQPVAAVGMPSGGIGA